ncbi:FGGY family pentulose kinase [Falsirhodobacter sp. alg1]|uniref:FGGY family pentulose kinase n=1 Tax=Falsirhodobacter sp. alg1 TaxID=1472418 RepID=UPI0007888C43|nr:FGGY family pentulose kinase [Falsirhodobacter sp. alg1]
MAYVLGIDVGSGSARCGVFDGAGQLLATVQHPIRAHRPQARCVEQSSQDIWQAVCTATKGAVAAADIDAAKVRALSFSATCSLVLLDRSHEPLCLSEGAAGWDMFMWMDQRAHEEARICNATGSEVLRNLGGSISVEMQIPKLLWLKRNRPDLWDRLGYAADLADFLGWRATGTNLRSVCTLGCKWTYDADAGRWVSSFFDQIGLADLREKAQLPEVASAVGAFAGPLTAQAAAELGLTTGCRVAVGLVDAHAGALGTSGLYADDALDTRLALIAGTSNCHIALTKQRVEVPGIWGPYQGAVLDSIYALEGGQSTTGAMLDQIVSLFAAAQHYGDAPHGPLATKLLSRMEREPDQAGDIMVLPDFLGNRAPFADPTLRGAILGLTLEDPEETFLRVYWAACVSIAYGTRQIIDAMRAKGVPIRKIHLSGGHAKSALLVRLYADATGCEVLLSETAEPVLLGAAVAACKTLDGEMDIARSVSARAARVVAPNPRSAEMHNDRYARWCGEYARRGLGIGA